MLHQYACMSSHNDGLVSPDTRDRVARDLHAAPGVEWQS